MEYVNDWFTIEEVDDDTFAISEYKHLEETHCYLLCGTKKAVLIDTGLGVSDILKTVESLTNLSIEMITTHAHWDHIGGHRLFNNIAVHKEEVSWLSNEFPLPLGVVKNNLMCKPCDFPKDFFLDEYKVFHGIPQQILIDGDSIDLGNRRLEIIHTPGHSPGHCCFYEPKRKYLYSGDLIYKGCLDVFYPCKLLIEANAGKDERAIEEAASRCAEGSEYIAVPEEMKADAPEEETVNIRRRRAR